MNKYKVKGITEVYIPSIDHLDVPYYILLLEDENNKLYIKKTHMEYSIGEYYMNK
ncbi:MAG: hypothetical protein M1308_16335 [Actinobacteria bacterium]|nr:hypothetical protein [Actinomycetota bacterium]